MKLITFLSCLSLCPSYYPIFERYKTEGKRERRTNTLFVPVCPETWWLLLLGLTWGASRDRGLTAEWPWTPTSFLRSTSVSRPISKRGSSFAYSNHVYWPRKTTALWSRIIKNTDWSTGRLARLFACSIALLIRLLAPPYSICLHIPISTLVHSLTCLKVAVFSVFSSILHYSTRTNLEWQLAGRKRTASPSEYFRVNESRPTFCSALIHGRLMFCLFPWIDIVRVASVKIEKNVIDMNNNKNIGKERKKC